MKEKGKQATVGMLIESINLHVPFSVARTVLY